MAFGASFLLEDFRAGVRVAGQKSIPSISSALSSPHKDGGEDEQGRNAKDKPDYEVAPDFHVPSRRCLRPKVS
jgi:hypothetical protein